MRRNNLRKTIYCDISALLLILSVAALRIWFVSSGQLNLVQDEAQYWDWSRQLQFSYYSKGPLIAVIIRFWCEIFGNTELGVRFGAILGSALLQAFLYIGVSRIWKRPPLALWTMFIGNTVPLIMASGILMTTDNPLTICWLGGMFCLYIATRPAEEEGKSPLWPFVGIGIFWAVGNLAKYMMMSWAIPALLFILVLHFKKELPEHFWPRFLKTIGIATVVGFLPMLIWNIQNDFVGVKHVTHLVGVSGKKSQTFLTLKHFPEYLGGQIGLITPWWTFFMLWGGWITLRQALGKRHPDVGLNSHQALMLTVFFWPIWLGVLIWSLHTRVYANWGATSYIGGIILAGVAFEYFWRTASDKKQVWKRVCVSLGIVTFVLLHAQNLLPLPDKLDPTLRLKGWADLGQRVDELKRTEFESPEKVFIFSENYDMTSALAFNTPGQPRTYNAWIGRRMNQYDIWPGPQDKKGWNAIYVRKRFKDEPEAEVLKMFERVGPPIKIRTTFRGKPARPFTVFLCYGYNGYWPRPENRRY